MKGLLARTLAVAWGTLVLFVATAGAVLAWGLPRLISDWNHNSQAQLDQALAERLKILAAQGSRDAVGQALIDLPVRAEYVVVTDSNQNLLVASHYGTMGGPGWNLVRRVQEKGHWVEIGAPAVSPWRFSAQALPFDADESNRFFVRALVSTLGWATVGAALVAGVLAWLVSRPLSRSAQALVFALGELKSGRRDVRFVPSGVQELDGISRGAEALQAQLGREESLRRQWAADIAHDLRTPLSVLRGQFEGMIDGIFPLEVGRIERNLDELIRLEHLVGQLAELTRIESPELRLNPDDYDPLEAWQGKEPRVKVSNPSVVRVFADRDLMDRALGNLVENAKRYGDPDAEIELSAQIVDEGWVRVVVENSGNLDPALIPRIFDRMVRGDDSRHGEGSGLGLAIVRAVAESHGGRAEVTVDNEKRRVRFSVIAPRGR